MAQKCPVILITLRPNRKPVTNYHVVILAYNLTRIYIPNSYSWWNLPRVHYYHYS